ncbi:unnamed protein product [Cylindrotheca closterium]|uniref:Uncharacterized protein n=1 Tax=Cylindrotheca closterium TaxID=2856 RepID=A0AAD2G9S4_9STRA|nr:unnamed protein product [Cylindrotheca closterium]
MDSPTSDNFSAPIDQSVLDRLPDFDDFDGDDSECDSVAEYSLCESSDDDDSFSYEGELYDDESRSLMGDESSLFTIAEETEEDLMSMCSCDDSDMDSDNGRIQMPRQVSLHAFLAKDGRRNRANSIDVTYHPGHDDLDLDNEESESTHAEENFVRKRESLNSFANADSDDDDDDDAKSFDSCSTSGSTSFQVAKRRLQKEFSLRKLKDAVQAADITSSFRKDDEKTFKCMDSIEQTLLQSSGSSRSSDGHQTAKNNLLSAISSSKAALKISKE